jgi:phage FluMu protein Com
MDCRCEKCNRLLATDLEGIVKIKCSKQNCEKINIFTSVKRNQTGADQQSFDQSNEKTLDGTTITD